MACTPITLSGISIDCANVGGVKKLYLIPTNEVTEVALDAVGAVSGITVTSGSAFSEFSFRRGNANFTAEGNRDDAAGTYFATTTLTYQTNYMDKDKRAELQKLIKGNTYAIVIDNNDEAWFLGYDSYLSGSVSATTGAAMADSNNYTLTAIAETKELPNAVLATVIATLPL